MGKRRGKIDHASSRWEACNGTNRLNEPLIECHQAEGGDGSAENAVVPVGSDARHTRLHVQQEAMN